MILPTKHITVENSLIGIGGMLLSRMGSPVTVSALWEQVRALPQMGTFERFTLALDLLYIMGTVEFRDQKLWRTQR